MTVGDLRGILRIAHQVRSRRLRAEHVGRARRLLDSLLEVPPELVSEVEQLEAELGQGDLFDGGGAR